MREGSGVQAEAAPRPASVPSPGVLALRDPLPFRTVFLTRASFLPYPIPFPPYAIHDLSVPGWAQRCRVTTVTTICDDRSDTARVRLPFN